MANDRVIYPNLRVKIFRYSVSIAHSLELGSHDCCFFSYAQVVILFIDSSGKEEIMPGKAAKVPLSEQQLELLHKISRETTASVRLV